MITLVFVLLLTACVAVGGKNAPSAATSEIDASQDLITAAQQEGSIVLYGSSPDPQLKAAADGFKARYGIAVNYTRFSSGPMNDRVNTELKAGGLRGDVVIHADPNSLETWSSAGVFSKLPMVSGFPIDNPYHTAIKIDTQGVMFNTQLVKDSDLQTWKDLLKPQFKGVIGLVGPKGSFGIAIGYYALMQDPSYGQAFFNEFASQKPTLTNMTPEAIAPLVASGEYPLSVMALESTVPNLKSTSPDAPVAFKYLDVSGVVPTEISINAKAAHPRASELFARWMMSREGQIAFNGDNRSSSPLGPLPGTAGQPARIVLRAEPPADVNAAWPALNDLFDRLYSGT